jgi:hypothetical protein
MAAADADAAALDETQEAEEECDAQTRYVCFDVFSCAYFLLLVAAPVLLRSVRSVARDSLLLSLAAASSAASLPNGLPAGRHFEVVVAQQALTRANQLQPGAQLNRN